MDKLYARNFAMRRPCGMLSKARDKSMAIVPTQSPSSRADRQNSVSCIITCWQLYPFLYAESDVFKILPKYTISWSARILSKILDITGSRFTDR